MSAGNTYEDFKLYLRTTSYYDLIRDYYFSIAVDLGAKANIIDVTDRYISLAKETIEKQEIAIDEDQDFWLFAAKQGYYFYKYSCVTKDVDGLLAFTILIEQWYLLKNTTDLFSSDVDETVIKIMLLMAIKGNQEMNAEQTLMPRDVICIVLLCVIALEVIKTRLIVTTSNPVVTNIEQLIIKIIGMYPGIFDLFFAKNSSVMRNVDSKNQSP